MNDFIIKHEDMKHIILCIYADGNGEYPSDDYVTETLGDIRREIFISKLIPSPDVPEDTP